MADEERIKEQEDHQLKTDNKWLQYIDSMFHGSSNRVIVQKRRQTGEDLLTVTRYSYNRNRLLSSKATQRLLQSKDIC
jgi:hypothetical protein